MKRDLDLVRDILKAVEKKSNEYDYEMLLLENWSPDLVRYNIGLLEQAGYIEATKAGGEADFSWFVKTMTNDGHDFLDHVRSDTLFNAAKEFAKNATGTITMNMILCIMQNVASGFLHLPGC